MLAPANWFDDGLTAVFRINRGVTEHRCHICRYGILTERETSLAMGAARLIIEFKHSTSNLECKTDDALLDRDHILQMLQMRVDVYLHIALVMCQTTCSGLNGPHLGNPVRPCTVGPT